MYVLIVLLDFGATSLVKTTPARAPLVYWGSTIRQQGNLQMSVFRASSVDFNQSKQALPAVIVRKESMLIS
jgi:hypothetical protein